MYNAALDTSGAEASVAVARGTEIIMHLEAVPIGRESAGLLPALLDGLKKTGIGLGDIRRWTIGMGPGSFTGIRVGAALVKGICAATGADYRGLPSSLALAAASNPKVGERVGVLHDARQDELIISLYLATEGGLQAIGEPAIVPPEALAEMPCDYYVARRERRPLPELPTGVAAVLVWQDETDARQLLAPAGWEWPADSAAAEASTEPVYVRPAVFVAPQEPAGAMISRLLERSGT